MEDAVSIYPYQLQVHGIEFRVMPSSGGTGILGPRRTHFILIRYLILRYQKVVWVPQARGCTAKRSSDARGAGGAG